MRKLILLLLICVGCKAKPKEIVPDNLFQQFDFSTFISTDSIYGSNGTFDTSFYRIDFYFQCKKDKNNPKIYAVKGFDQLRNHVTPLEGTITINKIIVHNGNFYFPDSIDKKNQLVEIEGDYEFFENKNYSGSGVFRGKLSFMLHKDSINALKDDLSDWMQDGYSNFIYIGNLQSYNNNKVKPCTWCDGRCYDRGFDEGDGEFFVNQKYEKNGWEVDSVGSLKELKPKWWIKKNVPNML